MSEGTPARLLELVASIATPLAVGGVLRPVRPIGAAVAGELAALVPGLSRSDLGGLAKARGDLARALLPLDEDPPLTPSCARLLCALNDLMQCLNPSLEGLFSRGESARLADEVERELAAIDAPATLGDALARHATLAGVTRLVRRDTSLSWWTGHALFVGRPPPPRLRAWPTARRVREQTSHVGLLALAERGPLAATRYRALLAALVARSPLTELALAGKAQPHVVRSTALASLCSIPEGRAVVHRLVERAGLDVRQAWEQTFSPQK